MWIIVTMMKADGALWCHHQQFTTKVLWTQKFVAHLHIKTCACATRLRPVSEKGRQRETLRLFTHAHVYSCIPLQYWFICSDKRQTVVQFVLHQHFDFIRHIRHCRPPSSIHSPSIPFTHAGPEQMYGARVGYTLYRSLSHIQRWTIHTLTFTHYRQSRVTDQPRVHVFGL